MNTALWLVGAYLLYAVAFSVRVELACARWSPLHATRHWRWLAAAPIAPLPLLLAGYAWHGYDRRAVTMNDADFAEAVGRRLRPLKRPAMIASFPVGWWALTVVFGPHAPFVALFLLMHEGGHALGAFASGQRATSFVVVPFLGAFVTTSGRPTRITIGAGLLSGLASAALAPLFADPSWSASFAVSASALNLAPVFGLDGHKLWAMQPDHRTHARMLLASGAVSGLLMPRSMPLIVVVGVGALVALVIVLVTRTARDHAVVVKAG